MGNVILTPTKDTSLNKGKETQMITSLEVAEMVEKEHSEMLKDIRRYIEQFNEGNIPLVEYFAESSYIDKKGEARPCFNITKKGCEFIAHKLTGVKGTVFTVRYIDRFHEMEDYIVGKTVEKVAKPTLGEVNEAAGIVSEIYREAGADVRFIAPLIGNLYKESGMNIPLPPIEMKEAAIYDQTEIAKKLGVLSSSGKPHPQAIGAIIDKLNISDDEKIFTPFTNNGHSGVVTQYKENVLFAVEEWLKENSFPSVISGNGKNYSVKYAA